MFFLTGYFVIFDTCKDNTSMLLIIMFISNISFYLLALRYLDFSLKLNICTMSFWLDYIENRTNGNHYDEWYFINNVFIKNFVATYLYRNNLSKELLNNL